MHGGKWIGVCFIALCGVSCDALADWTGKGEIGASLASGNSENESAPSQIQSDGRSAASPTTRSPIAPTGSARSVYEDDRFSAFEFQASLSTGLGYKIVDTERSSTSSSIRPRSSTGF